MYLYLLLTTCYLLLAICYLLLATCYLQVHVVGITFTSLIFTELIIVAIEIKRWHPLMLLAQVPPTAGATERPIWHTAGNKQ